MGNDKSESNGGWRYHLGAGMGRARLNAGRLFLLTSLMVAWIAAASSGGRQLQRMNGLCMVRQ